ncbi:MAG TPA: nitroreductase family protein [Candidatus Binataceae bacterium]|nr:nitroreductase family protein [Candidatus Binataceae bacterium]
MPLEQAMRTQRQIRRLKPDPVDDALVLHLIELALRAPTGSNAQNWEFVVVKDATVKSRLGRLYRPAWNVYRAVNRRIAIRAGDHAMLRILDATEWQVSHFVQIPVLIVACLRGLIPAWPSVVTASVYASILPSVQNLLLGARAAGLGAGIITLPLWSRFLARRALGLPQGIKPCAVVPLGWPMGRYGPTTRRPVEEVVSLDRYGNRAFLPSRDRSLDE